MKRNLVNKLKTLRRQMSISNLQKEEFDILASSAVFLEIISLNISRNFSQEISRWPEMKSVAWHDLTIFAAFASQKAPSLPVYPLRGHRFENPLHRVCLKFENEDRTQN